MLGQASFDESVRIGRAAFFLGIGVMGGICGLGLGSKEPNKLALMVSAGSLIYANYLNPVFKPEPAVARQFTQVAEDVRRKIPFTGGRAQAPRADVRFTF